MVRGNIMKALLLILTSASIAHAATLHTVQSGCAPWHKGDVIELRARQAWRFSFPVSHESENPTESISGQLQIAFEDLSKLQSFAIELYRKDVTGTSHIAATCVGGHWQSAGQPVDMQSGCGFISAPAASWYLLGIQGHTAGSTFSVDGATTDGTTSFFQDVEPKGPDTGDDLSLVVTLTPNADVTVSAAVRDVEASQ